MAPQNDRLDLVRRRLNDQKGKRIALPPTAAPGRAPGSRPAKRRESSGESAPVASRKELSLS